VKAEIHGFGWLNNSMAKNEILSNGSEYYKQKMAEKEALSKKSGN